MSPRERAAAAHAAAELAEHPRDKAALKAAAAAWERIAGPGMPWSHEPLARDLKALKLEVAIALGPCQPQKPPKAAPPAQAPLVRELERNGGPAARELAAKLREAATIEF